MAKIRRPVKLPDGTTREFIVPEEWGPSQIREALVRKGVITGSAKSAQDGAASAAPASPQYDDLPPMEDPIRREDNAPHVPSLGERFLRSQALGVRNVVEGVAGFPTLIGDAANTILNFIPGVNLQKPSEMLHGAMTDAGFPEAQTQGERIASTITQATAGAIAGIGAAKGIATPFSALLTENAGMQTSAAVAGGAAMGAANEADVGPIGSMAMGVAGALLGGVTHTKVTNNFARKVDARVRVKDAAIAEQEVADMLAADKVTVPKDTTVVRDLTEQLNELRVQAKIQEKVQQLQPTKADTIEQVRFKQRELAKMGEGSRPSIETIRERDRLRTRQIAEVEAKIREEENLVVQAKPEAKQAKKIAETSVAQAEEAVQRAMAIVADPTVPRQQGGPGYGRLKARDAFGNDVIGRIQKLSPQMAIAVRRVTQRATTRANSDIVKLGKFYDSPQFKALPKKDQLELDRAFQNSDDVRAREIMQRVDGLTDLYTGNVKGMLYEMQRNRIAKGADGFIEDFHPRVVKNLNALRKVAKRNQASGDVDKALASAERESHKKRGHGLDEREVAALINQYVGGRPLKVLKERRINEITPEMQKHYETSRNAMVDYIRKYHSDDATREFFKNSLGKEVDFGKNAVNEVTVGELLAKSLKEHGGLDATSMGEMAELLSVHFGVSRQGPGKWQRRFKNLFTAGTLTSPASTLTQFGDIAPVMNKFGVLETLRAGNPWRNKAGDITVYDIGVRELSKDLRDVHGTAKVVRKGLQWVGFDKLDTIMAGTGLRAALGKWTRKANTNPAVAVKELEPFFGKVDAEKLVDDLKAGNITDDVKTWLLHEMGDIRPISREDMPLGWNKDPAGRWKYSLLSWTLKQMNYARNNAQRNWRNGKKLTAVKQLTTLSLLMGLTNGSVMTVKDFLMGRDIDPVSNLVSGMLALGMSGKYALDSLESNRGLQALGAIVPALGISADAIQKVFKGVTDADVMKILESTPAGRNMVNLMAGPLVPMAAAGVEKAAKALMPTQNKPVQQPAPSNNSVRAPEVNKPEPMPIDVLRDSQKAPAPAKQESAAAQFKAAKELLRVREGDGGGVSYVDTEGHMTGGIGHLMSPAEKLKYPEGTPIPQEVREAWFKKDSAKAYGAAIKQAKTIKRPDMVPVLTSLNFQLGTAWMLPRKQGGKGFVNTWRLMKEGKFEEAAVEAADSDWATQTPVRLKDLQDALRQK